METIRVGVLGVGRGMTYARAYKAAPGAAMVGLCDRDRPRLEKAAAALEAPDVRLYTDYEEMLRKLDLIELSTAERSLSLLANARTARRCRVASRPAAPSRPAPRRTGAATRAASPRA